MSDIETLKMALIGYEAERQKLEATMAAIRSQLGGRASAPSTTPTGDAKSKHKMSAAGRKAIAEAQRKRWAAVHAAKQKEKPAAVTKKTAVKKAAVKTAPAKAAKKAVKRTTAKVAATPKRSALAKTKYPLKKVADNSTPVIAQPTVAAESGSTPEVVGV